MKADDTNTLPMGVNRSRYVYMEYLLNACLTMFLQCKDN